MGAERMPVPEEDWGELTPRQRRIVGDIRHWGCVLATRRMLAGEVKAKSYFVAYREEMDRLWDKNERFWESVRRLHRRSADLDMLHDVQTARRYETLADAAMFGDEIIRP